MSSPGVNNKKRLFTMLMCIALLFFILIFRTGWVQLFKGTWLQKKAIDQWTRNLPIAPKRGMIVDRNGKVLAQSASSNTVVLRPSQIKNADDVAGKLSSILGMDKNDIYKKAKDRKQSEVLLKRQITREMANKIRELNLQGVFITEESKRYYPNKNFLAQILGFTSADGVGIEGLEIKYDKYLRGVAGKTVSETDLLGKKLPYNVDYYVPPQDGMNVVTTIDYNIQSFVEKATNDCMVKCKAKKVEAIVMDPNTGEILALSNKPDYDPNDPPRNDPAKLKQVVRNSVISDVYEPGSTFKIITSSAGLNEGIVTPDSKFYCKGYELVDGDRIKCWRYYRPHGSETFLEGVKNSCNPVFMQVALRLGKEKFYNYLKAFGFGNYDGIDCNGEEKGLVMPMDYVKNVDLARIGFGQTIAVTPLQLATAVSAAVNGGNMMQPHLVKEIKNQQNATVQSIKPTVIRRVISEKTSSTLRNILEQVVSDGTGINAYTPGYKIGGKTGTAQKYENGKIVPNKHIASFIAFAPADKPQFVVLFVVDEPGVPIDMGSYVAAPYVKTILQDIFQYKNIKPVYTEEEEKKLEQVVQVPNLIGDNVKEATKKLTDADLQYFSYSSDGKIVDQMPKPGSKITKRSMVLLYVDKNDQTDNNYVEVPDVKGKSMIDTNNIIISYGLQLKIEGNGVAVSQDIQKGTRVKKGTVITVKFEAPKTN